MLAEVTTGAQVWNLPGDRSLLGTQASFRQNLGPNSEKGKECSKKCFSLLLLYLRGADRRPPNRKLASKGSTGKPADSKGDPRTRTIDQQHKHGAVDRKMSNQLTRT